MQIQLVYRGSATVPFHPVHDLDTDDQFLCSPKRFEPEHRIRDSFDSPVILLHDIVQIFAFAEFNVQAVVVVDTSYGRRVGTALVCSDLLWSAMQIDGTL